MNQTQFSPNFKQRVNINVNGLIGDKVGSRLFILAGLLASVLLNVLFGFTSALVFMMLRLLPRSATGQSISNYFSILTGVKQPEELDGPEHLYFVLVDSGRADVVGSDFHAMLRCIRCGACMNHCPVYQNVGGHAYGWVYPGPIGSVLTPAYAGLENALDLPNAATFCNQCGVVCPVKIPLPDLMRKLRERQFSGGLRPWPERMGLWLWARAAQRPRALELAVGPRHRVVQAERLGGARGEQPAVGHEGAEAARINVPQIRRCLVTDNPLGHQPAGSARVRGGRLERE